MAGTLKFSPEGVRNVVQAAQAKGKGVSLVKDQGVYLMANDTLAEGGGSNVLTYADGMDPQVDEFEDWYEKARAICGGDDFGEEVEVPFLVKVAVKGKGLRVDMSETHMAMEEL